MQMPGWRQPPRDPSPHPQTPPPPVPPLQPWRRRPRRLARARPERGPARWVPL